MDERLRAALEQLDAEQAFRLLYGAYEYLASDACTGVDSGTRRILERLRGADEAALLSCGCKLIEEHRELKAAEQGNHDHPGQSRRETLINEAQQVLYWATLLVVARGVPFDATLPAGTDSSDGEILARIRSSVTESVRLYNDRFPDECVEVREVALADLRQMAQKDYLLPYLRGRLLGELDPRPA
jgi:hypothetical protein